VVVDGWPRLKVGALVADGWPRLKVGAVVVVGAADAAVGAVDAAAVVVDVPESVDGFPRPANMPPGAGAVVVALEGAAVVVCGFARLNGEAEGKAGAALEGAEVVVVVVVLGAPRLNGEGWFAPPMPGNRDLDAVADVAGAPADGAVVAGVRLNGLCEGWPVEPNSEVLPDAA
jgi:hypothetical protein